MTIADRVKETTTTTGTGTYDLDGASTGFQDIVTAIGTGNLCSYIVFDSNDYETGIGTITSGSPDTLARTTVLESSNSNAAVDWGAGTKTVVITMTAKTAAKTAEMPFCRIYQGSSTTSFSANLSLTTLDFDTVDIDTHGFSNLGANADRMTIPASMDGCWFASGGMVYTADRESGDGHQLLINLRDSGGTLLHRAAFSAQGYDMGGNTPTGTRIGLVGQPVQVSTGDYFTMLYGQESDGTANSSTGLWNTQFWIMRVAG